MTATISSSSSELDETAEPPPAAAPRPPSRLRRPLRSGRERVRIDISLWAGAVVALLLFTQIIVPNPAGHGARGTPAAFLFTGLVDGLRTALVAVGMVLVYRAIRIINFAATALGLGSAIWLLNMIAYQLRVPFLITFAFGLVLGAMCGVLIDLLFGRRFAISSR